MRRFLTLTALPLALPAGIADAHNGRFDANGCHYKEVKPNRSLDAAVKKSRENACHDKSSSNYKTIEYFVPYKTMGECVTSGGRAAG